MDYPVEITLKRPVTVDDKTWDRLSFDEPDLGTCIAVEEAATPGEQTIILLAGMAGVGRAVMMKVKESDYREIGKRVLEPYQADVTARAGTRSGNGKAAE